MGTKHGDAQECSKLYVLKYTECHPPGTIKSQCRTPCTEPQCVVYFPWRYYRPTISCEPGTVWPYQLTPGKSLSQKNEGKKKHWGIKTVFEGLWIYSVRGIPRQNENNGTHENRTRDSNFTGERANRYTKTSTRIYD